MNANVLYNKVDKFKYGNSFQC